MRHFITQRPILVIVLAQLCGCSLWFSVNGVSMGLTDSWGLNASDLGRLTNAVLAGFICGTLILSISGLADRFRASHIFVVSAFLGALANLSFALVASNLHEGLIVRFLVGLCLAGIYPTGMKLLVSWSESSPGLVLGLLVGMLTLGTALPHGLTALELTADWQSTLILVSGIALIGGAMVWLLGDGPYTTRQVGSLRWGAVMQSFQIPRFRASAMGYFGHMWELYAFWTLTPWLVRESLGSRAPSEEVALWSFAVIGIGAFGAFFGGWMSRVIGSAHVARISLALSGLICAFYPLVASSMGVLTIGILLVWGFFVIADSGQFSAISSQACPRDLVGSALAMQNSTGFLLSVVSISLVTGLLDEWGLSVLWVLIPGPVLGVIAMKSLFVQGSLAK
jgi:MFS family permease